MKLRAWWPYYIFQLMLCAELWLKMFERLSFPSGKTLLKFFYLMQKPNSLVIIRLALADKLVGLIWISVWLEAAGAILFSSCILVTLKLRQSRQTCQLAHIHFWLKNWANLWLHIIGQFFKHILPRERQQICKKQGDSIFIFKTRSAISLLAFWSHWNTGTDGKFVGGLMAKIV
jgi:hypothetical protein